MNLGNVRRECGDLEGAEAAYREAVTLAPDAAEAYSNLGGLCLRRGRRVEAAKLCTRAIEIEPNNADAHHYLGYIG